MLYVFRWRCLDQPVVLTIAVHAAHDKEAGDLAAAAVADFTKGHRRELRWEPQAPAIIPAGRA
jgi:hypothetical protein